MTNKKLLTLILSALLASLLLGACGTNTPPQQETDLPPMRIGYSPWASYSLAYIAQEKRFFEQEGVEVEIVAGTYDGTAVDFASKKLDANMTVLSDCIAQAAAGIPLQVVWVFDNSAGGDVVVGSGALTGPEDLRGKRIGVAYGSFGHIFVIEGLAVFGLTQDDVTIVNVLPENVPAALAADEIDAGHTWEPYLSEALDNGNKVLFSSADTPGIIADVLVFQSSVIEERPGDVQAVVRALVQADAFWRENAEEGNTITAQAMGVPPEEMPAILSGIRIFSVSDNLTAFDPAGQGPESLYQSGRIISDLFVANEIISQAPDLESVLNPSFAQALSSGS